MRKPRRASGSPKRLSTKEELRLARVQALGLAIAYAREGQKLSLTRGSPALIDLARERFFEQIAIMDTLERMLTARLISFAPFARPSWKAEPVREIVRTKPEAED